MLADKAALDAVLNNPNRFIVMIDESAMLQDTYINKVNASKQIFICITRAMPFRMSYPMCGLYRVVKNKDLATGAESFEILRCQSLPYAKLSDFNEKYDKIIVESAKGRSEHALLSSYLSNVVCANGRGRVEVLLRNSKGRILVLVDMGNVGQAYKILLKRYSQNPRIQFYDYQAFEQLLYESSLVSKNNKDLLNPFNYTSIEKMYENVLESETAGTALEYSHGRALPSGFTGRDNYDRVFDGCSGAGLKQYIDNFEDV
jgi:hypothetical protein